MTMSHGKRHRKWPEPAQADFLTTHSLDLRKDFPIRKVGDIILQRLPIIGASETSILANWGELQFRESEVLLATMETLAFDHGVPSLPVHDSLIVPEGGVELAVRVLKMTFETMVGVEPSVTVGE